MKSRIIQDLNEEQQAAVLQTEGPVLVFAGAGSGKTRVLTYRIAHLIRECEVRPHHILAVTFTNKAANEMKSRIAGLIGDNASRLWTGTFHGICARMLREYAEEAGIARDFTIYDDSDQMALMREALDQLKLEHKRYPPRECHNMISRAKEKLILPAQYGQKFVGQLESVVEKVYKVYQRLLAENHALDFDDLILYAVLLLRNSQMVREHYQERFHYVHVDEYQDINHSQYELVRILSDKYRNIFCVGDDDQSIYRWRGAEVGIILQFEEDFPDARVFKLERNYRSTRKIIEAAHHVVKRNRGRADKKLWTDNEDGADLQIMANANDREEANNIAIRIRNKVSTDNRHWSDFAVLYRTNSQSRVFEEAMINHRIPYKLIGSLRFYERREIKDVLAYMRLAANPYDIVALKRVINVPHRGIGQTSLGKLEMMSREQHITLFEALKDVGQVEEIAKKARASMVKFRETIDHLRDMAVHSDVHELTNEILTVSGMLAELNEEHTMESRSRLENLQELLTVTKQFSAMNENPTLSSYLEQVALISDIDTYDESGEAVTLMTLHAAKGLEFPVVFMPGMEEGVFPHWRSKEDHLEMEEERRLCYVGMTRAREELILSYAHQRMSMGQIQRAEVSRFIDEIPAELFEKRAPARASSGSGASVGSASVESARLIDFKPTRTQPRATYKPAQKVRHAVFGNGIVLNCQGEGSDERVTVAFEGVGIKKLAVDLAGLETR